MLIQYISIYLFLGLTVSIIMELLLKQLNPTDKVTIFERIVWIALWPMFVIIFIIGMGNDQK